jgi:hypothetical protein
MSPAKRRAVAAGILARRVRDREAERPFPADRGSQMRWVFGQSPKDDLTAAEQNYRRWFLKDPAGYMAEMERLEAEGASGARDAHPAENPPQVQADAATAALVELCDELLDRVRQKAGVG